MNAPLSSFFYQNTNLLVIRNTRAQANGGGIVNNATGTAEIQKGGITVANGGPVVLTYIAGSQGQYEATFSANANVVLGEFITVLIKLAVGSSLLYRGIIQAKVVDNV